jgi:alanine racemase
MDKTLISTASERAGVLRPTWAEIDTRAFAANIDVVASGLPAGSRLIAVLKADAYGHGAVELARVCRPDRVAMIATALLEESLALRNAGITIPLLVLGTMNEDAIELALDSGVTPGIPGPEALAAACRIASHRDIAIHLKLDSGMGRMGVVESELTEVIQMIRAAPRLRLDAVYTHFANADEARDPFTETQIVTFDRMTASLREAGLDAPLHHLANSAATMRGIVRPGDFVRCGIVLFGPSPLLNSGDSPPRMRGVMRWRTEIARLKELPAGHGVGYGTTFRTTRPSRIATLPVGYADGYNRGHSNKGEVLIGGRRAPVAGRVSMDLVTVDVTDVPGCSAGDEAVLLGAQGEEVITAEELAAKTDTISYEVFCSVSKRVPRLYI